jgi:ribosomal protein S18 acetylase RimI-like enzyme
VANDSVALNSQRRRVLGMFRAEKMRPDDFAFAVQLANTQGWDMANVDFEYMSTLEPEGCFILWQGHERVGMSTCVSYGRTGWFGNLAVLPEYRRKGAGTILVKHSIQYLKSKGVEGVGLYAYQHLVGFYRNVGFKPHDDFVVLSGTVTKEPIKHEMVLEASEKDASKLIELDKRCLSWDRKKLFESILLEEGKLCYYSSAGNGDIRGFIFAKVYGEMAEIGPLVCRRNEKNVAFALVSTVLDKIAGLDVYAYVPAKEEELVALFLDSGLKEKFRATRMFLGSVEAESCIYLPESLERG